ncbi:MAG: hypothetical protein E4H28_05700, partial [Gemmatimonadales bacterium]
LGSSATVSTIVEEATKRAGLNVPFGNGANLLRRSLATGMLHRGASLDDIGKILRHKNPCTTAIYTKVDLDGRFGKSFFLGQGGRHDVANQRR